MSWKTSVEALEKLKLQFSDFLPIEASGAVLGRPLWP